MRARECLKGREICREGTKSLSKAMQELDYLRLWVLVVERINFF